MATPSPLTLYALSALAYPDHIHRALEVALQRDSMYVIEDRLQTFTTWPYGGRL